MPDTVQFVDSVASSPTLRLDLNDGAEWRLVHEGTRVGLPSLRRAVAQTLLTDGATYPASAYGDRTLTLRLALVTSTVDEQANELQKLMRELDRPVNILKWQPTSATHPVFFRTIRSEIAAVDEVPGNGKARYVTVEVLAEPFAVGLKETVTPITVSNDPAAASNGCYFDVSSVKGDVETPLILKRPTTNRGDESVFAVRRHGTPSATPFLAQAEALTQGTDTSTQANSATFSGSSNNYSRVTFGTSAWTDRLSANPWPSSASVDARGTYRVFARCRKNGSSSTVEIRLGFGASAVTITNDPVTVTWTSPAMADLGLMSIPLGADPVHDGLSNTELSTRGVFMALQATRSGGTDTLDVDYLLLMPADDRLAIVHWSDAIGSADRLILDGTRNLHYGLINSSGVVAPMTPGYHVGGLPMLSPNQTNRIFYINEARPATAEDSFPTTWSFEPFYFPKYIYVRPAST